MSANTKIEWCDSTFNPWIGCAKISPACDNCYAERDFDKRKHVVKWGSGQPRKRTTSANWRKPLQWNTVPFRECTECGWRGERGSAVHYIGLRCPSCGTRSSLEAARRLVFCASLADIFDNEIPIAWLADFLDLCRLTPNIVKLLLTKRIGNVKRRIAEALEYAREVMLNPLLAQWVADWLDGDWPPSDIWIGATICNQEEADRDIPKLLNAPAVVRFLSIEPMLGPINLDTFPIFGEQEQRLLHWVIVGGESGPDARPTHPDWVRDIRDQCAEASVSFHFKQWGEWAPGECAQNTLDWRKVRTADLWNDGWHIETIRGNADFHRDDEPALYRAGKKSAGRMLDGIEHNGFPQC